MARPMAETNRHLRRSNSSFNSRSGDDGALPRPLGGDTPIFAKLLLALAFSFFSF
jgi:hypothetical protein